MKKKDEKKNVHVVEHHEAWELETQTEGLDKLQGERLEPKQGSSKRKNEKD